MREKRRLTIVPLVLSILLLVGGAPATAQPGTVLAIADFADPGTDGGAMIQAERLSGYLQHRLQALEGDRGDVDRCRFRRTSRGSAVRPSAAPQTFWMSSAR